MYNLDAGTLACFSGSFMAEEHLDFILWCYPTWQPSALCGDGAVGVWLNSAVSAEHTPALEDLVQRKGNTSLINFNIVYTLTW
jgi:hypothetical protein